MQAPESYPSALARIIYKGEKYQIGTKLGNALVKAMEENVKWRP